MDIGAFGKLIKDFRMKLGITQKQLAEGLCTKDYIYKIEKGTRTPSAELIEQISVRLGIDLNDYISLSQYTSPAFVKSIVSDIDTSRILKDYDKSNQLLKSIENHEDFQFGFAHQFYLWNRGVIEFELNKNFELAKSFFIEAINVTREFDLNTNLNLTFLTGLELKIINALAVVLYSQGHKVLANSILKTILDDDSLYTKYKKCDIIVLLLLTYSAILSKDNNFSASLGYLMKAQNYLISNDDLYMLSQVTYQIAMNFYDLGNDEKSKEYMKMAKTIAILKQEKIFEEFIDKRIDKYEIF